MPSETRHKANKSLQGERWILCRGLETRCYGDGETFGNTQVIKQLKKVHDRYLVLKCFVKI